MNTNNNIPDLKTRKAYDLEYLAEAITGLRAAYSALICPSTIDPLFIEPLIAQTEELLEQTKHLRREEENTLRIWNKEVAQ